MATATAELPQHLQALARANQVRRERADLKRQVLAGRATAYSVILTAPDILAGSGNRKGVSVAEVLTWQRRWGQSRAEKFLRRFDINGTVELHSLSPPRRKRVAKALKDV